TLSRLENAVDRHACEAMAEALVALYIRERQRSGAPTHLVLDIDGTDDPVHGNQEALATEARERALALDFPPPAVSAGIDLLLTYARSQEVSRAEKLVESVAASLAQAAGWH